MPDSILGAAVDAELACIALTTEAEKLRAELVDAQRTIAALLLTAGGAVLVPRRVLVVLPRDAVLLRQDTVDGMLLQVVL